MEYNENVELTSDNINEVNEVNCNNIGFDGDNCVEQGQIVDLTSEQSKSTLDMVVDGIEYNFTQEILVKPLDDVMVVKDITTMTEKKDEDGKLVLNDAGAVEYDTVTETKEVPSVWKKGIVLAIPTHSNFQSELPCKVGDTIIYNKQVGVEFDLFKTSVLVTPYGVRAVVKS